MSIASRTFEPREFQQNVLYEEEDIKVIEKCAKGFCLDIGANVGIYTILMADHAEKVYAFEPEPQNFKLLENNIKISECDNTKLFNAAVTDYDGEIDLHLCDFNPGMHRTYDSKWFKEKKSIKVKAIKIDNLIDEKVDFIKIDIEGAEFPALRGMQNLISNYHPKILIEFHPPSIIEFGDNPRDIFKFLQRNDYEFRLVNQPNEYISSYARLATLIDNSPAKNVICI